MRLGLPGPVRRRAVRAALITLVGVMLAATPAAAVAPASPAAGHWTGVGPVSLPAFVSGDTVVGAEVGSDGRLYVYGLFRDAAGDPTADSLVVYDPVTGAWVGLGSNGLGEGAINGAVYDVAWYQGKLVVAGLFANAGLAPQADCIASWDGAAWSGLGSGTTCSFYMTGIAVVSDKLYAAGQFANLGGDANADNVAVFNGTSWSGLPGADGALGTTIYDAVAAMVVEADGTIYVGGTFEDGLGGIPDHVAQWDPVAATWHSMVGGFGEGAVNDDVDSLAVLGGSLYASGLFTDAGGDPTADYLARWTGTGWVGVGAVSGAAALNGRTLDMTVYGTTLIVSGSFTSAAGTPGTGGIAAWNGARWLSLGNPVLSGGGIFRTGTIGRNLYAAGTFTGIAEGLTSIPGTAGLAAFGLPGGPTAPRSLAGTTGSKRVSLTWQAPASANGSPVTDYIVQFRRKGTSTWKTFNDGVRTTRAATVTGLTTGVTYEFRVRAKNAWAIGGFSVVLTKKAG